jgi:hypothetical protein
LRRFSLLIALAGVAALALAVGANAASRMYFGFQDDQNFRYAEDRLAVIARAASTHASVVRITVNWFDAAPKRPANAKNALDRTYRLDDVDEAIRTANNEGMEALVTIWGTPKWANGGKGPNVAPKNMNDLKNFAQAVASRYSGRYAGYPYARFFSVWNESNLQQFLSPQFDSKGKSVAPATYAKLYQAAYSGFKAGNSKVLVGIGETSPRGRDKPSPGAAQDSHSPGKFAELVAKANKKLKFDAWSMHPYSTELKAKVTQKVKWPNVTLGNLKQLETSLDTWFGRKNIPIWITEYGYQTQPPRPGGVSYSTQKANAKQAFQIAQKDPRVAMFIWFIFRDQPSDDTVSQWQQAGGVVDSKNKAKPALGQLTSLAPSVDARNAVYSFKAGTKNPKITFSAIELKRTSPAGATIGIDYTISNGKKRVGDATAASPLGKDGWLTFKPALSIAKGTTFRLDVKATDVHGTSVVRTLTLKAS